jgi:hypothetical protein
MTDDGRLVTYDRGLAIWAIDEPQVVGLDGLVGVTALALWADGVLGVTHAHSALLLDAATGSRVAALTFPAEAGIAKGLLRLPHGPAVGIALEPNSENTRPRRAGNLTFTPFPATRRLVSLDPSGDAATPGATHLWARAATGANPGIELGQSRAGEPDRFVPLLDDRPVDIAADGVWLAALRVDPALVTLFAVKADASFRLAASCDDALATSVGVTTVGEVPRLLTTRPGAVRVFGADCVTQALYETPDAEPVKVVGTRSGLVVAGTRDGALWAWDAAGNLRARVALHREPVSALAVDPLGRWVVSGAWDGRVRFLDLDAVSPPSERLIGPLGSLASPGLRR